MRVIGGEFRSRRIQSMPGVDVRPTPDRLRESLFNILSAQLPGAMFVDAYAGTGAVGIEALSRGAAHVVFLERNKAAVELIRTNLKSLGAFDRASVIPGSALKELPKQLAAHIVFLDPPFAMEKEYRAALDLLSGNPPAIVIAQHSSRFDPGDRHGALERYRILKQGDNSLSFYRAAGTAVESPPA
jgi:16S rRNA (guanine(966)-N(2))-methyltransferase RsmD